MNNRKESYISLSLSILISPLLSTELKRNGSETEITKAPVYNDFNHSKSDNQTGKPLFCDNY